MSRGLCRPVPRDFRTTDGWADLPGGPGEFRYGEMTLQSLHRDVPPGR